VPGWNLHNRLTLILHAEHQIDSTYELIDDFLKTRVPQYADQLLKFQRASMIEYHGLSQLPVRHNFDWDFLGYVSQDTDLDRAATYEFSTHEDRTMSFSMFLENFWFGRKRNFGKAKITRL
jgi:hypothetical protein